MKIVMLMTPSEEVLYSGVLSMPPHTLGVVTSYIRGKGYDVKQYDLNIDLQDHYLSNSLTKDDMKPIYDKEQVLNYLNGGENPAITRFIEKLLAGKSLDSADAVGISSGGTFYWMTIHAGFLIAYYIKKKYGIPVVVGGNNMIYLSSFKDKFSELWQAIFKTIDFVIVGAGLESFRKILERLKNKPDWIPSPNERQQIKGLIYMKHGEVACISQDRDIVVRPDFKGLRLDYYMSFLKNPEKAPDPQLAEKENLQFLYKWPQDLIQISDRVNRRKAEQKKDHFIKKLTIPYVSLYHCPYNCAFCSESNEENQVVIGDPVQVVDDLEFLINEYDTPYIKFYNNYFNVSKKFASTFCEEVKRRKLKLYWSDCARFTGINFDFLQKLKESGCQTLWFGLESASPKMLKMINKKIDVKEVEEGLRLCQEVGIWANLEVIVGFPNETLEDFRHTVRFMNKNADKINFFQDNRYYVIPYSIIGKHPDRFNIELEKDLITYDLLMKGNLRWFSSGKGMEARPNSFHMWPFNEIGGKGHDELFKEGLRRQRYLQKFKKKEFTEIRQMLFFMDSVSKRSEQKEV